MFHDFCCKLQNLKKGIVVPWKPVTLLVSHDLISYPSPLDIKQFAVTLVCLYKLSTELGMGSKIRITK